MSTTTPTQALLQTAQLIKQGAEAKVYKTTLHLPYAQPADNTSAIPVLLKHRFTKQYRHPSLNATLTKQRVAGEARALMKCLRCGVSVPGIRTVDAAEGMIGIEWIDGASVRMVLGGGADDDDAAISDDEETGNSNLEVVGADNREDTLAEYGLTKPRLMHHIGVQIAKMHSADVIHGDLTTSNMMLRRAKSARDTSKNEAELVLIDFGLSFFSALAEDKAVDLYVLERAFSSTHPEAETEGLFDLVLDSYAATAKKDWTAVKRKLDEVRLRGRKRSMVG